MSCIQLQSPLFVLHPKLIHRQRLRRPKLLWLSSNEPAYNKLQQFQHYSRGGNINAISNPILLGITHPSKSGDIYGLLQLGIPLLSLYFISNFIVPNLVVKYFEFDKESENQKRKDDP